MVQFRKKGEPLCTSYWKLRSSNDLAVEELMAGVRHHGYPASVAPYGVKHATKLFHRAQRGLFSYEYATSDDLVTFCRQRGLPQSPNPSRALLKRPLEQADIDDVFHRFTAFPVEIRLFVYSFYNSTLHRNDPSSNNLARQGKIPQGWQPPPVWAVSRQIRQESLPIFYGDMNLVFQANRLFWSSTDYGRSKSELQCLTKKFIRSRADNSLACINLFDMELHTDAHGRFRVRVKVRAGACFVTRVSHEPDSTDPQLLESLQSEISAVARVISESDGYQKHRRGDLSKVFRALDRVLPKGLKYISHWCGISSILSQPMPLARGAQRYDPIPRKCQSASSFR